MIDIETQLRRALREPPSDPLAKERALVRLRSHVEERAASNAARRTLLKRSIPIAATLVVVVAVVGVFGSSLTQPAVAREAERLAQINVEWASTSPVPPVTIERWRLSVNSRVVQPALTYTLVIRSSISVSESDDGSLIRTEEILSRDFYASADRNNWIARGSPDLPEVGSISADGVDPAYNLSAVSTDADDLRESLEHGDIAGYLPNDGQAFEIIGSLLTESGLTSAQRIALFDVVGSLGNVEVVGDTPDPLGRIGIGFSYEVGTQHQVLIFDGDTGQPLAFEEYSPVDPTQLIQWQAFDPPGQPATDP